MQKTWVRYLCQENLLKEETATHFNILDWRIPPTEKPGGLRSIRSQKSQTAGLAHSHIPKFSRLRSLQENQGRIQEGGTFELINLGKLEGGESDGKYSSERYLADIQGLRIKRDGVATLTHTY